jgi:hypothetical protein
MMDVAPAAGWSLVFMHVVVCLETPLPCVSSVHNSVRRACNGKQVQDEKAWQGAHARIEEHRNLSSWRHDVSGETKVVMVMVSDADQAAER